VAPLAERRGLPDLSLSKRYRWLLLAIALPLFLVVLALAITQYVDQRRHVLRGLEENNASFAISLESVAKLASDHVLQMKAWSEGYLASPPGSANNLRQHFHSRHNSQGEPDGYSLDSVPPDKRHLSGQVLWISDAPLSDPQQNKLLDQALDFFALARLTHEVTPYFQWSYTFPASRGFANIYPWANSRDFVERQGLPDMRRGIAGYFDYEIFTAGTPEKNPDRKPYWTAPYMDAGGSGAMVSHGAPVYLDEHFQGIVGTDLRLVTLEQFLRSLPRLVGQLWILDASNNLLADSAGSPPDSLRTLGDVLPGKKLTESDLRMAQSHPGKAYQTAGMVLVSQQLRHAPWRVVYIISEEDMDGLLLPRILPYGVILAVLAGTFFLALYLLRREFITPALDLVHYIQRVSRDPDAPEPRLPRLWQTWAQVVSRTFAANREASRKLRESEAFMSVIVENALLAVLTMDEDGRVVEFNPAAERTFGWSREQVLGRDMADLLIPDRFREAHRQGLARFLDSDRSKLMGKPLSLFALRVDGSEIPVELTISVARLGDRRFFTAFVADLTERVQAEAQLARQRDALRQNEKLSAMGALLAGVAHELNNPLAILMGRAALLEGKATDPAISEDAARIKAAADRCGRIVRTFLSMARKKPVERHAAQLNEAVQGALDLLGYNLRTADIQVRAHLTRDLPDIEMDVNQIGQIVVNLLVNAQQALADQPAPREIRVSTAREGDHLTLRVADNGPGVSSEMRERIFDPFFTTKPEGSGTGVGLSVSRSIAREHSGELLLEDSAKGACFLLRLPLGDILPNRPDTVLRAVDEPQPGRVLVVDDETEVAALLVDILASAGYQTATATGGEAALDWLAHHPCDMVFCDMRMPGMDGPALWRELNSRHPELARRTAFITGDTFSASVEPFLKETGQPWLEKPFTPEAILALAAKLEA
jgi:PAS domain S-box-containing protein